MKATKFLLVCSTFALLGLTAAHTTAAHAEDKPAVGAKPATAVAPAPAAAVPATDKPVEKGVDGYEKDYSECYEQADTKSASDESKWSQYFKTCMQGKGYETDDGADEEGAAPDAGKTSVAPVDAGKSGAAAPAAAVKTPAAPVDAGKAAPVAPKKQ